MNSSCTPYLTLIFPESCVRVALRVVTLHQPRSILTHAFITNKSAVLLTLKLERPWLLTLPSNEKTVIVGTGIVMRMEGKGRAGL